MFMDSISYSILYAAPVCDKTYHNPHAVHKLEIEALQSENRMVKCSYPCVKKFPHALILMKKRGEDLLILLGFHKQEHIHQFIKEIRF